MIDAIQRSGVRLLGIVNDFLDLTALEEHKIAFKKKSFNLVDLAGEVVADFLGKAAAKSLSLTVVPPYEPLPEVLADRDRAREIIINLLGNAIQYTEKGGVTLSFKKGEGVVELSVTDTGAGIKPDDQKSLFQKFQTVSERFIHSKEYGSGMGLYISNLLAESMNGTVRLKESTQGIGSTFTATLPISDNKRLLVG
jgi:signal transduction histidine kinase